MPRGNKPAKQDHKWTFKVANFGLEEALKLPDTSLDEVERKVERLQKAINFAQKKHVVVNYPQYQRELNQLVEKRYKLRENRNARLQKEIEEAERNRRLAKKYALRLPADATDIEVREALSEEARAVENERKALKNERMARIALLREEMAKKLQTALEMPSNTAEETQQKINALQNAIWAAVDRNLAPPSETIEAVHDQISRLRAKLEKRDSGKRVVSVPTKPMKLAA